MVLTLSNIEILQVQFSVIKKRRVTGYNNKNNYQLLEAITVSLSNGETITIPKGFEWDLSSVPRVFWAILPPDGDFELASLIHDWLYANAKSRTTSRAFADKEMLLWSMATSGTRRLSIRNTDNYIRYYFVRMFGWLVWKKIVKI